MLNIRAMREAASGHPAKIGGALSGAPPASGSPQAVLPTLGQLSAANPGSSAPRPIGIDLFAGAGGMSLGFEQAGFDVRAAVEHDPVHSATHQFNFPQTAILAKSARAANGDEIREAAGIGDAEIDCVFGGPPCQGFSLIGYRALDDPRNDLVREFVRLVVEMNAKTFVFENVKGLTAGSHRVILDEVVAAFETAGYEVRSPWQILNAAHFGVPQHRERLFLMGARKDISLPIYPVPITVPADVGSWGNEGGCPIGPTCADAIGDLPDADRFAELLMSDETRIGTRNDLTAYAQELCRWHDGHAREWEPDLLTSSMRTNHTEVSRRRFSETRPGATEPVSRFYKLSPMGLSRTLRAGTVSRRGGFTSPRPIHYAWPRCVTVREMARLHGFPDWFRFHATKWHGARQIGNAVPPPLARAVATSVVRALGVDVRGTGTCQTLGPTSLLRMGMTEAADWFGVQPLPQQRDRKGGFTKRSQAEVERDRQNAEASGA